MKDNLKPIKRPKKIISDKFYFYLSKKEITWIIIIIIISSFMSFMPIIPTKDLLKIITNLMIFSIIILTNIYSKKIISKYYSIRIEHKIWEFNRYWFYKASHLKKPFPIGLVIPFFTALLSIGYLKPFLFFQFEAENITSRRILKSRGQRKAERKDYINEEDLAYTSAAGFYALLLLAIIGSSINWIFGLDFGLELAKYSIYYGIWNLLPVSNLDGTKLFLGAFLGWIFILMLYLISLVLIIL